MSSDTIEQKPDEKEKPNALPPDQDEVLDAELNRIEDADAATASKNLDGPQPAYVPPGGAPKRRFRDKLKALLRSKKFWVIMVLVLLAALVILWFVEPTRIWMVNTVGQRTQLSVTVNTLAEEKQPAAKLKNATVTINGQQHTTDDNGMVKIDNQPYGKAHIVVSKRGYEEIQIDRFLDFDPFFHQFGGREADEAARNVEVGVKSVGLPVSFTAIDWLSGKPITGGSYIAGDLRLQPDEKGVVAFKAPPQDGNKLSIRSEHGGAYNDKTFEVSLESQDRPTVSFVPAGRHYYTSSRDGALSVYSSNIDGSDQQLVIPGTGKETAETAFTVSPSGKYGLLASTRDGARNDKNTLLQRLYVVDLEKELLKQVDEGQYFEFADWAGDTLVYTRTTANPTDPAKRETIKTADVTSNTTKDLSSAYGYGRIVVSHDRALFIENMQNEAQAVQQFAKRADMKTGVVKELATGVAPELVQTEPAVALLQTTSDQKWHQYHFNSDVLQDSAPPAGSHNKVFLSSANPAHKRNLLIDRIDGKFTLIAKTIQNGAEKELYGTGGMTGPVRWLNNDVVVFRVVSSDETADYAVSVNGGEPKKISDITAASDPPNVTRDINQFKFY